VRRRAPLDVNPSLLIVLSLLFTVRGAFHSAFPTQTGMVTFRPHRTVSSTGPQLYAGEKRKSDLNVVLRCDERTGRFSYDFLHCVSPLVKH